MRLKAIDLARLLIAWATVAAFLIYGELWLSDLGSFIRSAALFLWLLAIIAWCAFGVVERAEHLAELLGEPLGTLILTLSIVTIEVALIAAVMLTADAAPTLGRDTMFALLMIILNGVVGLALLLGGLRHHEQDYNLQGAAAYLALIVPLSVIALVLPDFTRSTPIPTLSKVQGSSLPCSRFCFTACFWPSRPFAIGAFRRATPRLGGRRREQGHRRTEGALLCTGRVGHDLPHSDGAAHRAARQAAGKAHRPWDRRARRSGRAGRLIALIVFTPEGMSALRAALDNQLQRAVNLCLGAALSTIGLTVPAVLGIGLITEQPVILGLDLAEVTLLALTLVLSTITFSGSRTTVQGAVHLVLFFVYLVLIFSP